MTAHTWMQRRSADSVALALLWVTLVQLSVGVLVAIAAAQPSQEVLNDRLERRQDGLDGRVLSIEQLNIPARLAVLEKSSANSEENWTEVRKLNYGIITTLIGLMAAQIVQIRGQRKGRRDEA